MKLRHVIAVSTCTAAAGVLVGACGGGDNALDDHGRTDTTAAVANRPRQDPRERLRIAEDRTKEQRAADVDVEMAIGVDGERLSVSIVGSGDMTTGAADVDMGVAGAGVAGAGVEAHLRLVTDNETVWFTRDEQAWYSMAMSEFSDGAQAPTSLDASTYLAFLQGVGGEVTQAGTDEIDGEPATHYEADLDVAALADATDAGIDTDALEDAGITALPFDVWIGEDDLVRRITVELDADVEGSHLDMDISADFSNFRDDFELTTPPAGQVLPGTSDTLTELLTG